MVNGYISEHSEHTDLIYNIIDRNLKTRVDVSLINKVWPNLIPTFDVALANKYENFEKKVNLNNGTWFASRKLDGVRVITIIDNEGNINFYSRNGKPFLTLDKVAEAVRKLNLTSTVLDGEMCVVDEFGDENFTDVIKLIRRKDFTIPNPCYKLFDMLTLEEFNAKLSTRSLRVRLTDLLYKVSTNSILNIVGQTPICSAAQFEELKQKAADRGWEGLMLRFDGPYEGKRSKSLLKVKSFHDAEYIVEDVEMGFIRYIKDGSEVEEQMLSGVKITHKGNMVSVGSGFSIAERQKFYANPELIMGRQITVKYFEETTNDRGTISLRFPTIKKIWEGERDV
jgi:DNA ligase-1